MEEIDMDESDLSQVSLSVEGITDEFSEIKSHYENGIALTDSEMDKIADKAVLYLKHLLSFFGEHECEIDEYDGDEGELILDITGGDLAILIGRHGNTLDALQMVLSSLMSASLHFYYPIVVDVESYKSRRRAKIQSMARSAAERVKKNGNRIALAPMNGYERRLVHIALRGEDQVTTHSEGEDPYRCVVITAVNV